MIEFNKLRGTIPVELGSLDHLEHLSLSKSSFLRHDNVVHDVSFTYKICFFVSVSFYFIWIQLGIVCLAK